MRLALWVSLACAACGRLGFDTLHADSRAGDAPPLPCTGSSFAAPKAYPSGDSPTDIAVGDLDGDGHPDLALADRGTNSVQMLQTCTP